MNLADFKALVQGATQVTITHYPSITEQPSTSRRAVTAIDAKGIHTRLQQPPHKAVWVDWPSQRSTSHRIDGRSLTWIGNSGTPLFTYRFPLSAEEALERAHEQNAKNC
ncbi:hypothetical protein [Streptomyces sp. NBC_01579]|uniref:hypothetical protein n=1 Tax=Streptomyces sp. NBC_01579 TaxID=2975885 RepID=UPI00387060E4